MIPDPWLDSAEAIVVTSTIAVVLVVNVALVFFICLRRMARSLLLAYVQGRERRFIETVFGSLIEPPGRGAFYPRSTPGRTRSVRVDRLARRDRTGRPRPGDWGILESMFLRLAVEVRGADRNTITGICEDAGFVDRYLRRLRSRRWWVRLAAAQRLGIMRSARATFPLTHTLDDANREVSLASLRALGEIGDPRSYDRLLAAMEDETRWESILIAEVVLQLGPPVSAPILKQMRSTNDVALQAGYARLLGLLREPAAVVTILPLLNVDDELLRLEAVRALGLIGDSRVIAALLPRLEDRHAFIRAATAEALGRIGDAGVVEHLRLLLADADRSVRYSAAAALAATGSAGHLALDGAAQDNDATIRVISQQVLAEAAMGLH